MGMSIDEAIYCMESYLPSDNYTHCTECKYYGCNANKTCASSEGHQVAIDIMRKYQQLEDFARWIAEEIIDEDMWELNHLSFAELACRKLVKLGIMQESDGEYTYEVVEDGNDTTNTGSN